MRKAAVLWTGGKDSFLAFCRAKESGLEIICLATFVPENKTLQAHPVPVMQQQATTLDLPLRLLTVKEPYKESYIEGLAALRAEFGVETVITGDIDLVDGLPNWIVECCTPLGIEVLRPLWQQPRLPLLNEILQRGIQARISWINHASIPQSWKGRFFDEALVRDLERLSQMHGIDPCGENGEYHTMVTVSNG